MVCAFGDIKVLTLQGNALEPCICRSRYRKVKKSYKITEKFGESEKIRIFVVLRETGVLTVPHGTQKNKVMKKNLETKFRCVFKALCANNQYRIGSIYFVGKNRRGRKGKGKKVSRKNLQKRV